MDLALLIQYPNDLLIELGPPLYLPLMRFARGEKDLSPLKRESKL